MIKCDKRANHTKFDYNIYIWMMDLESKFFLKFKYGFLK